MKILRPHREDDSGFRWGCFSLSGSRPWPLRTQSLGGSVIYPYPDTDPKHSQHIRDCEPMGPIIVKGNHAEQFTHPREYSDRPSYYWDNSLLPEIMPRPPDRSARQWWTRLVKAGPFPGEFTGTENQVRAREQAVNDYLRSFGQAERWDLLIRVNEQTTARTKHVIWLEPQSAVTQWFYGESRESVIDRVRLECQRLGLTLITRAKPPRSQRWGANSLRNLITNLRPHCVIGVHSAAAQEALCTLTPYVSLGGGR